jgi:hypothetical protein
MTMDAGAQVHLARMRHRGSTRVDPGPRGGVGRRMRSNVSCILDAVTIAMVVVPGGPEIGFPGRLATSKIPSEWGKGAAAKSGGWKWWDPKNSGNYVRIDPGDPNSRDSFRQIDHVHVRSGGRVIGRDGKPMPPGSAGDPAAHIPLTQWLKWSRWNAL